MKNFYLTLRKINFKSPNAVLQLALIVIAILGAQESFAQTSCSNAISITINGSCSSGSVSDNSQNSPNISGCSAGTFRRERWYTFTVTGGPKNITITASAADRDLYLQLISATSSCSGLTDIACANADNNSNSAQTETLTASLNNGIYYIKVVNCGSNNNMSLSSLCVTAGSPCLTPTAQPTALVLTSSSATSVSGSFTAASPAPNKYLVVRSTSATAPSPGPLNGTSYTVGSAINGATVISVSNSTSFTDTLLSGNTRYYYYVYSYNDTSCSGVAYNTVSPLTNDVVTCTAVPGSVATSGVSENGFTFNWAFPTGGTANTTTYTIQITTDAGYSNNITGSPFGATSPTTSLNITGLNANTTYYYRIVADNGCSSNYVTGSVATTCASPMAQPTSLVLASVTSTGLSGSFTAASPAPSGYLIVRSTSATAPTLTNGTTYAVGFTGLTPGTTRVIQGSAVTSSAVTFTDSGLTTNTTYYYHIFSYNNGCTGAPYYLSTSPLTNNASTCPAAPTAAVNSGITSTGFNVSWTASATGGSAATINYTLEVYTDATYATPITGSPFAVGTALNYSVSGLNAATLYYYRIIANNGCNSSYLTGSALTLASSCPVPSAATDLTIGTVTSSSIPATFSGTATGYLVIASTNATPPSQPINGTTYNSGNIGTLGSGLTFIQSGTSTTIAGTGLTGNTRYYYYIYSYNSGACLGGPVYNTTGILTGNAVTCPAVPNSVTTANITQTSFTLNWAAPTGGSASTVSYLLQVTTDAAFTDDVLDSPFTLASSTLTLDIDDLSSNTTYYYRILARNGCNSSYITGSVTTLIAACVAPTNQAFNFTNGAITTTTYPASFLGSADGFLVIRSTSATPPTQPVNGTLYSAANISSLGSGLTFVQSGSANSISSTGLTGNTTYYYYVFAYTSSIYCTGGPVYNTAGPLVGTGTTCPAAPATITASAITLDSFTLNWATSVGGTSAPITYTVQITTNAGYTNNIAGSPFTTASTTLSVSGLNSGTTYYYRILANNGCVSAYTAGLFTTTSITNDNCSGAIALTTNPTSTCTTSTTGTTYGATQSSSGCSGTADDDVWYKFTATATSHTVTVTPTSITDIVFQAYSGTCAGLTNLGCINATVSTATEANTFTGLTIGNTYFVRVYSYSNGNSYRGDFNICVTTPVAPINNDCSGAVALTVNSTTTCVTSTLGTTQFATQSQAACNGTADDDVWYKFTATTTSHIVTVTPINISNLVIQSFSGACGVLTNLGCVNNTTGSGIESTTLTGLTVGNTYYVRVYSYGNGIYGTFNICLTTACTSGNGTGVSNTTCPNVIAGAAGMNGSEPTAVPCYATNTCTNLEAIYPDYNETTNYTVSSIPYAPPYQYNCLANPISVNVDDVWSPTVNLPFNFCFYGNTYNKVLIGSNGALTFDTTTYSPGGYSDWSFSNNLPSTSLFLNAIFGVYHDIDPSKGGQVGWELVTLSSGCRALVAAWSDIPMYSTICNNSLYTGMIVLHENSNIIDVYIKEKNVCSSWNGGNAVVGIQNANGTRAVVAPNRNSTDSDWTVNEEAWRFSPSGASVASVKWYQGSGTSGIVVGNTSAITVCPSAATTYTAEVTYSFCNGVTTKYTDETTVDVSSGKVWTGAVNSDWSNDNNWSPSGVPTNLDCITIPNVTNKPVISGTSYDAFCYNLTVNGSSTLKAESNNTLTVTDFVKVNTGGAFNVEDSASLIQINDTATNVGAVTVKRTAYVKAYDYVYWSSPIRSFNSGNLSPTSPSGYVFKWNPTIANGNGGQGNWVAGTENMAVAKGYIAISPGNYSYSTASALPVSFRGVPNNGIKRPTISRGSYTGADYTGTNGATITNLDDNWNLIGNPYPSAIDATSFLAMNTNINGNIRLWTHGSPVSANNSNPFYGSFIANYDVNDYISYNGTGSTPPGFNGKIAAGQAFFVIMNDGSASNSTVTFKNSLRSRTYDNSQFYKQNTNAATPQDEKSRIWLSLINANGAAATTLVGYITGATYDDDRLYDASHKVATNLALYSWIDDKSVIINGRPAPFDDTDFVNLGATVPANGTYTIGINQVDGLFADANQDIFLEDTELNVIHNLRSNPYSFTATVGNYANRFILRYRDTESLSNNEVETTSTYAYVSNHTLHVKSDDTIKQIYLYDISGKLVNQFKPAVESNQFEVEFPYQNGVYLATIIKSGGEKVTVKLLR